METLTRTLLYDRDYSLWLETTSQLLRVHVRLRNRQLDRIDIEHLAEELEDMGKSEKRAIESNLEILLKSPELAPIPPD